MAVCICEGASHSACVMSVHQDPFQDPHHCKPLLDIIGFILFLLIARAKRLALPSCLMSFVLEGETVFSPCVTVKVSVLSSPSSHVLYEQIDWVWPTFGSSLFEVLCSPFSLNWNQMAPTPPISHDAP